MKRSKNIQTSQQLINFVVSKSNTKAPTKLNPTNNAVYNRPYMNNDSIRQTMENYRAYRHQYNTAIAKKNIKINKFNQEVKFNILENPLTKQQVALLLVFTKHNPLFTKKYNEEVKEFCENYGNILPKRRYQKLKDTHENVMHVYLGFYAKQIRLYNARLDNNYSSTKRSIEKLVINYTNTASHKINKIPRLDICKKTLQNRTRRLREAGVIIDYLFINSSRPVYMRFNSQIMQVLDVTISKKSSPDNQFIISLQAKSLHIHSDSTGTSKKPKKKEIVDNNFNKRSSPQLTVNNCEQSNENFYKNTKELDTKPETVALEKRKKIAPKKEKNMIFLQKQILNNQDLAKQLHQGKHDNYKPSRLDLLEKDLIYNTLSRQDFRLLVIQIIIKYAAKLWVNNISKPYQGEWLKFIYIANKEWFIHGGVIHTKDRLFNLLHEYIFRIDKATRWINRVKKDDLLFPCDYFDTNRRYSYEVGFQFTKASWGKELKRRKKQEIDKKQRKLNANKRQRQTNKQIKADKAIKRFIDGKYDRFELEEYFKKNLDHDLIKQLPTFLKSIDKDKNLA